MHPSHTYTPALRVNNGCDKIQCNHTARAYCPSSCIKKGKKHKELEEVPRTECLSSCTQQFCWFARKCPILGPIKITMLSVWEMSVLTARERGFSSKLNLLTQTNSWSNFKQNEFMTQWKLLGVIWFCNSVGFHGVIMTLIVDFKLSPPFQKIDVLNFSLQLSRRFRYFILVSHLNSFPKS